MNKVFIKGESLEKTKEELKLSQEETEKWEKLTPNKGNNILAFLDGGYK